MPSITEIAKTALIALAACYAVNAFAPSVAKQVGLSGVKAQ